MYRLELLRDGDVVHGVLIGARPVSIGRAPVNDLVLSDASVSWHHAVVWVEDGRVAIRDLGSTNGIWLGDERVTGATTLAVGVPVRLGDEARVRVARSSDEDVAAPRAFALADTGSGVRLPLRTDRHELGEVTLLVHPDEVWLCVGDEDRPLAVGETFHADGKEWRLVEVEHTLMPTAPSGTERYPYQLACTLDGPTGAVAVLADPASGAELRVEGNRAVLLYLLGKAVIDDQQRGAAATAVGWRPDAEVQAGIWGRSGDDNKLHVLLHRLRSDLRDAGLDPWCLQKKRRYVRIRVGAARLGLG